MFNAKRARLWQVGTTAVVVLLFSVTSAISQTEPALAHKYIAQGKEIKSLHGNAERQPFTRGRIVLGGDVILSTSKLDQDVAWIACASPDGHILWSARAEEEPEAASLFPLTTDGEFIWTAGLRKDGVFRFGKFDAHTLAKIGVVKLDFAPTKTGSPCLQLHSDDPQNFDLQVSLVQPSGDSIRVALFTRDLHLRFDKLYKFDFVKNAKQEDTLAGPYLVRIPDGTGYYLCLRRQVPGNVNGSGGACIIKIDNDGEVVWANTYALGSPEMEFEPHETIDGSILLHIPKTGGSVVARVNVDGTVRWAIHVPRIAVNFPDFGFGWEPYRFIRPYLFASGDQLISMKLVSSVLAINYETGKIEKQVKLASPGGAFYTEKTKDSICVTLLNTSYGGRASSQAALLCFDFDLNLRAARSIRDAEPHWPILRALPSGRLLSSYSYHDRKTLVVETVNENFESPNSCSVLQKANLSVTKSNFEAKPINVVATPMTPIKISNSNGKTSEAEMRLVPFELVSAACDAAPH